MYGAVARFWANVQWFSDVELKHTIIKQIYLYLINVSMKQIYLS